MKKKSSSCSFLRVIKIISLCHDGVKLVATYGPNSVLTLEGPVYTDLNEQLTYKFIAPIHRMQLNQRHRKDK